IIEPTGEDFSNSSGTRDGIVRSVEDMLVDLDDAIRDFYHHMSEVHVDRIVGIETAQRRLEADQLIATCIKLNENINGNCNGNGNGNDNGNGNGNGNENGNNGGDNDDGLHEASTNKF
ncbi:hypothetical protein Tco_0148357, partial [Tanacetum coccineum]